MNPGTGRITGRRKPDHRLSIDSVDLIGPRFNVTTVSTETTRENRKFRIDVTVVKDLRTGLQEPVLSESGKDTG